MKAILIILFVFSAIISQSQPMKSVKINTSIDEKFRVVQHYITEANQQVKIMIANEAVLGEVKNRELSKQLLLDLQAVMKVYRAKFITAKCDTIQVDSLQIVQQKTDLLKEINRLKAEINSGEDSIFIQPKINELTNKRNELNKIMKNWTPVRN